MAFAYQLLAKLTGTHALGRWGRTVFSVKLKMVNATYPIDERARTAVTNCWITI